MNGKERKEKEWKIKKTRGEKRIGKERRENEKR